MMTPPTTQELIVPLEQALSLEPAPAAIGDSGDELEPEKANGSPLQGLKRFVEQRCVAANRHLGAAAVQGFLAGAALNRAKEEVPRKQWLRFMRTSFGDGNAVSIRTCQRYMKLAGRFPQIAERVGKVIDATRVSFSQVEEILSGMSIRAALRLAGNNHDFDFEEPPTTSEENSDQLQTPRDPKTKLNNWLTPAILLRMLERLWDRIDLDPCASEDMAEHVPARQRYLPHDDGLALENSWFGNVFVNPGHVGNLRPWVERATAEFVAGRVAEALLFLPASTDADWAELVQPFPHAFLHTRPCVVMAHELDAQVVLSQPGMLIYLAAPDRLTTFAEHFGTLADIYRPYVFANES